MRKIVLTLIAAVVLLGCGNEPTPVAPDEQKAITFGSVETRAEVSENDITEFGVYAFVNQGADGTDEASVFESLLGSDDGAERVYFDSITGEWTYDNVKFWMANRRYHFLGIYPFDATSNSITNDISGISRVFTTPDEANMDIMAAHTMVNSAGATPSSVEMTFEHMLSKVCFKVHYDTTGNQDDEFTLTGFTISNIKKEGTLQSTFDGNNSWSVNQLYNMDFEWEGEKVLESEFQLWGDDLMLIPQTIAPSVVNINIKYKYNEDKNGNLVDKEVDTYLPAITWKPGLQYVYHMILHEDDLITFNQIEIADWGSPQQGGAVIIK